MPRPIRYIALLRGINLGGHRLTMDQLRKHFEKLGFENVETFIASGNVIFESPSKSAAALEKKIAGHLEKSLGYAVPTYLRSDAELARIYAHPAFSNAGDSIVYIGFLSEAPSKAAEANLMKYRTKLDDFHVHEREVYWLCRTGMSESAFFRIGLDKALGMKVTVRNSTTVGKLVEKYPGK
jgi:uncharacterized protein (DUF1697 family)